MQICHERAGERHFHQFKIITALAKCRGRARGHDKGIASEQRRWILAVNLKPHGSADDEMKQDVTIMRCSRGMRCWRC